MFEKLSAKTKARVRYGFMIAGICLVVSALFYGHFHDGGQSKKTDVQENEKTEQSSTSSAADQKNSSDGELASAFNRFNSSVQNGSGESSTDDTDSSNDGFTKKEQEASKEVAVAFAKTLNNYDSKDNLKYVKESKKYITQELYQKLYETYSKKSDDDTKKVVSGTTEVSRPNIPDSSDLSKRLVWRIDVNGKVLYKNGDRTKITNTYMILMKNINNHFKVVDFVIDASFIPEKKTGS